MLPPDETAAAADLVLLAIPDDVLAGTVRGLVAASSLRAGQIVVHTSGAYSVETLAPATELGALPLALHPAMTFTGRQEDLDRLTTCCFGVTATEGDEPAWNVGEALVMEMGAEPVRIPASARSLYHAALAHGANHLITLVTEATDLLRSAGIGPADRVLAPLLSAALDNALRHGDRSLTGPVARGDVGTLRGHLDVLEKRAPQVLPAYRVLARRTADRAEQAGLLDAAHAAEVQAVLDDDSPPDEPPKTGTVE
jgi:predicted short-subunit dehydrogenase-like oxidoreductase (DUF2520 family)